MLTPNIRIIFETLTLFYATPEQKLYEEHDEVRVQLMHHSDIIEVYERDKKTGGQAKGDVVASPLKHQIHHLRKEPKESRAESDRLQKKSIVKQPELDTNMGYSAIDGLVDHSEIDKVQRRMIQTEDRAKDALAKQLEPQIPALRSDAEPRGRKGIVGAERDHLQQRVKSLQRELEMKLRSDSDFMDEKELEFHRLRQEINELSDLNLKQFAQLELLKGKALHAQQLEHEKRLIGDDFANTKGNYQEELVKRQQAEAEQIQNNQALRANIRELTGLLREKAEQHSALQTSLEMETQHNQSLCTPYNCIASKNSNTANEALPTKTCFGTDTITLNTGCEVMQRKTLLLHRLGVRFR